jgi:hypothetical protein
MTVYVAEIDGRAIAAFNAENEIQAEGRASSKAFRGDLTVLENEGQPLWNGADEISCPQSLTCGGGPIWCISGARDQG